MSKYLFAERGYMELNGCKIGFAITGSFCTFDKILVEMRRLREAGAEIYPIFSNAVKTLDNRFWSAADFRAEVERITQKEIMDTIPMVEPIGPKAYLDVLLVAPCTGNTIAKIVAGVTDSPVLMAVKAHVRNSKPVVISISSNDGLSANFKNIGQLMNMKNYYFVPFGQDDCMKKPTSLIAHVDLIPDTLEMALMNKQIQPVLVA